MDIIHKGLLKEAAAGFPMLPCFLYRIYIVHFHSFFPLHESGYGIVANGTKKYTREETLNDKKGYVPLLESHYSLFYPFWEGMRQQRDQRMKTLYRIFRKS